MNRSAPPPAAAVDCLVSTERLRILRALRRTDEPVSEAELAARATAIAVGTPLDQLDDDTLERRRLEHCHVHLPKLADHELVDWDREHGTVTRTEKAAAATELLDAAAEFEPRSEPFEGRDQWSP